MTKVSEIKQQRPDRISHILITLEKNGYIESIETPNTKFYIISCYFNNSVIYFAIVVLKITANRINIYIECILDF